MSLLTVAEVAGRLRMGEQFVKAELVRKNLRGSKVGGKWRVSEADLDRYLADTANRRAS